MRIPALSVLGAFLGLDILSTHANVACTTSQHLNDSGVPAPSLVKSLHESLYKPTNGPCDAGFDEAGFSSCRTESTVFTITRTDQDETLESCKGSFDAIIRKCIGEKNFHGGTLLANGFLYEVYHDNTPKDRLTQRATPKPPKTAKKKPAKPTFAKPQPAKPSNKACPLKPKTKGSGQGGKLTSRAGSDCEEEAGLEKI